MSELYKKSGVDIGEANSLSEKLKLLGADFKNFVGEVSCGSIKILNCCDGIGTKIIPLYSHRFFRTIAIDLVAANLNDMATKCAKAVAFSDYIAVNKLNSASIAEIILELKKVLDEFDCKLLGGETSEMPVLLKDGAIDICGFAIGISDGNFMPEKVADGDVIIGLKSNGIHANGFSLIRKLYSGGKLSLEDYEECLKPSFIYYDCVRKLWENNLIKAAANITGGGILTNLVRVIPENLKPKLDFSLIPKQNIYEKLFKLCGDECYEVFNCGVGFCLVADEKNCDKIFDICKGFEPFVLGKVVKK